MGLGEATVVLSMKWESVPVAATTHKVRVAESLGESLPVTQRLVRSLPHPDRTANVMGLRYLPDGRLFAAGYPSGVVQVWDVADGKELRRLETGRGYRGSSEYAEVPADFSKVFVPVGGRKVTKIEGDPKRKFKIEFDGRLDVWDLQTGKSLPPIRPEKGRGPAAAEVSPDGALVLTVEETGHVASEPRPPFQVWLYETATGKGRKLGEGYGQFAFRPGGREILASFATNDGGGQLKLLGRDGKELALLAKSAREGYGRPAYSPDGKRFVVVRSKGLINEPAAIELYDSDSRKKLAEFASAGNFPFFLPAFSPDGKRLAAGDYGEGISIWDLEKREMVARSVFKGKSAGVYVAFSPDGTRLAVPVRVKTDNDRARKPDPRDFPQPRLLMFDLTKGGELEEWVLPHGWVGGLAFSKDGKTLAVGSAGAVHILTVEGPKP